MPAPPPESEPAMVRAMRHPRRNEIFRDVGAEPHSPTDEDFIDVVEFPFEPDSALLLCTDGLTDMVPSSQIAAIVTRHAGNPERVVGMLLRAANERREPYFGKGKKPLILTS